MRVIAGTARRINLITPKGLDTRPTTDRIKETLFNMINNDLCDANFLDLFSGSGGIGIEAISRGAKKAIFVENGREACECINKNLNATKLQEKGILISKDFKIALKSLKECFDIVFMDPPYNLGVEKEVLTLLLDNNLVNEDSMVIIEAELNKDFDFVKEIGYELTKEKRYKTNKHVFLKVL